MDGTLACRTPDPDAPFPIFENSKIQMECQRGLEFVCVCRPDSVRRHRREKWFEHTDLSQAVLTCVRSPLKGRVFVATDAQRGCEGVRGPRAEDGRHHTANIISTSAWSIRPYRC